MIGALLRARGALLPSLLVLIVFAALVGLGKWQLDRKVWKEGLIEARTRRLTAAPTELPSSGRWADLDPAADEFRRVRLAAALVPGAEGLVFTSGSSFRPDVSGPGYWVFARARLADDSQVVIERGFVPEGLKEAAARAGGALNGPTEMVGVLRWPEAPGWFTPPPDAAHNLWFARDHRAIAAAKDWGEVAPFYVDLEGPQPPGGFPRAGPLEVQLPNDHLQYAITWFGLAAVVAISFGFWLRARIRE
jgi:cytochrome oxidase assembly protein ShyY1